VEGKPVQIGGTTYTVPDLTVDAAEAVMSRFSDFQNGKSSPISVAEVIVLALQENYPTLTVLDVAKRLKFKDAPEKMKEVLAAAGLQMGGGSTGEAPAPPS
jgi:hypothetical protein